MDDNAAFDEVCQTVYVTARAGEVDCGDAFELASSWMDRFPQDPDATELVLLSMECAAGAQAHMAEVALRILATANFAPGFPEEPEWLARLEEAMTVVNRDVAATGRPGLCQLRIRENAPGVNDNAYVETWNGRSSNGIGIYPVSGSGRVQALVAVADDAQDAIMADLSAAWPLCPVHQLGAHPEVREDAAVWWCSGDGGHIVAPIGEWPGH